MQSSAESLAPADLVGALVTSATQALAVAGVASPRLDAELLLAHACQMDRAGLYSRWHSAAPAECRERFGVMLARRQRREPLQYIIGRQEFWSLELVVTPDVLIPRPETELLVELALARLSAQTAPTLTLARCRNWQQGREPRRIAASKICDLGTGSGCLAIALAHELPDAEVWALDISEAALAIARRNARLHGVAERIRFLASDVFSAARDLRFDAIVSNPPYVRSRDLVVAQPELAWEPRQALDGGPGGLSCVERVVGEAAAYLNPGGWLLMEIGADQGAVVERLANAAHFATVSIRPDYAGLPRALVARR